MTSLQEQILDAALPLVPFDGWSMETLRAAAAQLGLPQADALRAFPEGVSECLVFWNRRTDAQMVQALSQDYHLESMKIRERIATAVTVRLTLVAPHREAVRRGLTYFALPWHSAEGMKALYRTVDDMWVAAGDTSTDWNFYSKRALLAKVYMTTVYFWLNDHSQGSADTQAYLRRRIDDVMKIQQVKGKLKQALGL